MSALKAVCWGVVALLGAGALAIVAGLLSPHGGVGPGPSLLAHVSTTAASDSEAGPADIPAARTVAIIMSARNA